MKKTVFILSGVLITIFLLGGAPRSIAGEDCFDGADKSLRDQIFTLINNERGNSGKAPFRCDYALSGLAQAHARDMYERDFFDHISPEGESPFDRLADAEITYTFAGENIAWGQNSAKAVMRTWMSSPPHKSNLLGDFTAIGIGAYEKYYVLLFIKD